MFKNLDKAKLPVLLWSSGMDSTLLLVMLREQNIRFDIVQIRDFWTKGQLKRADKMIAEMNLKVFSFPPSNVSFIGNGDEISTVWEYAVGTTKIPVLRDVIDGKTCIAELEGQRLFQSPINWDYYIVGSRKDDTHWAFKSQVIPSDTWTTGGVTFEAPLYDWTRQMVKDALIERGLDADEVPEEEDTGNLQLCTNCLKGTGTVWCPAENREIPSIKWDGPLNLSNFRKVYNNS